MIRVKQSPVAISSIVVLLGINAVFVLKYSDRISALAPLLAVSYLIAGLAYWILIPDVLERFPRRKLGLLALSLIIVLWLSLLVLIPKESLNVDRWLMIKTFWDNVFDGVYPYVPRYNASIPSQLPAYQVLALPFHMIGEVGLLSLLIVVVFVADLKRRYGDRVATLLGFTLLMPAFWWEAATRSTIIANFCVASLVLLWLTDRRLDSSKSIMSAACIIGLLCSTRSTVVIPLCATLVFMMRRTEHVMSVMCVAAGSAVVAALTLLPLYLSDPPKFWLYNPLLVQARFSPVWFTVLIIAAAMILGLRCRTRQTMFFASALLLLASTLPSVVSNVLDNGISDTLFKSRFDVSYLLQSLPFFFVAIVEDSRENSAT